MERESTDPEERRRRCELDRCEAKRTEWAKRWQCDEDVHTSEDKPWKHEEGKIWEEAVPRLKECGLEKESKLCKAKTGVGCDGFHTQGPSGCDEGNERRNRGVGGEGGAEWEMAATSLHDDVLLIS